jgi:hypothetical protein
MLEGPLSGDGLERRSRRGPHGGHLGCAPSRWRDRAVPFGHTLVLTARPAGRGAVGTCCLGALPRPLQWPPRRGPASQAARAVPSDPQWRAHHRDPSATPAPGACPHTWRTRTRPARIPYGSNPTPYHRSSRFFFSSSLDDASGATPSYPLYWGRAEGVKELVSAPHPL